MPTLADIAAMLKQQPYAVVSTIRPSGTVQSTLVNVGLYEDGVGLTIQTSISKGNHARSVTWWPIRRWWILHCLLSILLCRHRVNAVHCVADSPRLAMVAARLCVSFPSGQVESRG